MELMPTRQKPHTYGRSDGIDDGISYDSARGLLEQDSLVREAEDTISVVSQVLISHDTSYSICHIMIYQCDSELGEFIEKTGSNTDRRDRT